MILPSGFIDMMKTLLGNEADDFFQAMQEPPVCSVRLNSRKPGAVFPDAAPVKWCRNGFYLSERPIFTLDPLLHAGAYYVQDASSMIYSEVTSRIVRELSSGNLPEQSAPIRLSVLDLCAAPGGKTTAIIDSLPDGSRIIANEYVGKRAGILRENLAKWGYPLASVTNRDSEYFARSGNLFDIVAADAPCSGEGMMRKDPDALEQWSEKLITDCVSLQREILRNAVQAVKPGGFLIYSTCTFNRYENEENARFIVSELGMSPFNPDFPEEWGIPGGIDTDLPVFRFMPHKTRGEGLFLAIFRKPGTWIPSFLPGCDTMTQSPPTTAATRQGKTNARKHSGTDTRHNGGTGGKSPAQEVPPIENILSIDFDRSRYPEVELTLQHAVAYLRREAIVLPPDAGKGLTIVTFKGLPLGMVKNIGPRANNLYPKNWRILMQ